MQYKRTTQVPNALFDTFLPHLSLAELKVLLVIIRQTNGWIDPKTGKRKERDRISHSQFISKTGLSRRRVSSAIQDLLTHRIIRVTSFSDKELSEPMQRKGRQYLYYATTFERAQFIPAPYAQSAPAPMQKRAHNKTKNHDETKSAAYRREIGELITRLQAILTVES